MSDFRCVVRVTTEAYQRGDTYFFGKSIRTLKRLTTYDHLGDLIDSVGVTDGIFDIVNFDTVDDGVYELVINSTWCDYETDLFDEWDWKLVPYMPCENEK